MWYVTNQKHGVSANGLSRVLGVTRYMTVWTWLQKLRVAMVRPGRDRLSGTIEVDETYVGGPRPGKRGRGAEGKSLVVIAVEDKGKAMGRIRLRQVANASADCLTPAVAEAVEPGSVVRTDDWKGYNRLSSEGYSREIARPTTGVGKNLLPLANRVASLLKRWLEGTHQGAVRSSHLDYYLDEFTFRFNRRTSASRGKLFHRLLQQAVAVGSVTDKRVLASRAPDRNHHI
jgi:transposase-like protein